MPLYNSKTVNHVMFLNNYITVLNVIVIIFVDIKLLSNSSLVATKLFLV
jgi:hypothetical protein